jgi:hypothetical protein
MYSLATFDLSRLSCLKSLHPEHRHLITSMQISSQFAKEVMVTIYKGKVEEVLGDHSPAKRLLGLERLHVRDLTWANTRQRDELRFLFDMEGLIITDQLRDRVSRTWSSREPFQWYLERV